MKSVNIAPYTTFGIGGLVRELIEIRNEDELLKNINSRNRRIEVISGGSNVVFKDENIDACILRMLPGQDIKVSGNSISCWSGTKLSTLVDVAIENGLAGLESLSGIPGSVGGAIVGNAGAYGQQISDTVSKVSYIDRRGACGELSKDQCNFAYRDSLFKRKPWILSNLEFELIPGDKSKILEKSNLIIDTREKKYKKGLLCPGSFFKNIQINNISNISLNSLDKTKIIDGKIPAGYLLESIGAKGISLGGLSIAKFHGNLLINEGNATYQDVTKLAHILKDRVWNSFKIILEEEIKYIS